jgi:hypothetical protein
MNRQIVYTGQLPLSGQELKGSKSIMKAIGQLVNDAMLSVASPALLSGLSLVPTSPASMSLTLNPGTVYQAGQIDYVTTAGVGALTAYGSLAADATAIILQGIAAAAQNITGFTAPGTTGQSTNFLVEFQVQTQDGTLLGLNYYNSANPQVPLIGPAGAGTQQATERSTVLAVQVLAGSPAATGSQVTPSITSGWLPGYVVTVAFGQTTVLAGNIAVAAGAPFLASLTSQHHLGIPGTAPKIQLGGAVEVQGVLPLANMSAFGITNLTDLACSAGALLVLNFNAGEAIINGVPTAITSGTLNLTASATNYVYVNGSGVVAFNTTGWPTNGSFYPLAIVPTGTTAITSVTDKRGLAVMASVPVSTVSRNAIQSALMNALTNGKSAFLLGGATSVNQAPSNMTSDTAPSPYVASASAEATSYPAWNAFTGLTTLSGLWQTQNPTGWIKIDLGASGAVAATSVTFGCDPTTTNTAPKNFVIEGSNTGAFTGEQTALSTQTGVTWTLGVEQTFAFANTTAFRYYRINITANTSGPYTALINLQIYSVVINGSSLTAIDLKTSAGTYPLALSFANGLNSDGTFANIPIQLGADVNAYWGGLTASATNYLFVARNTSTGALSALVGAYKQTIQTVAPSSPVNGMRYYDPIQNQPFAWNGTAWIKENVIPVGECVANGSSQVTSYLAYVPLCRFDSGSVSCAASTAYTVNHGVGHAGIIVEVFTSTDNINWTPLTITSYNRTAMTFTTPTGASYYRAIARQIQA